MAMLISLYASPEPDGLERVAEDLGFIESATEPTPAPIPDYEMQGVEGPLAGSLAGLMGVIIMFVMVFGIASLVKR